MSTGHNQTIEMLVADIRAHLLDAQGAETKFRKHRLAAGQKLVELRGRVEKGEAGDGVNWWEYYEARFSRSRKDAEKLMQMAKADDPEAAEEEARTKNNEQHRNRRAADVRGRTESQDEDVVDHALHLVEEMDAEERQRFDAVYMEKYHEQ